MTWRDDGPITPPVSRLTDPPGWVAAQMAMARHTQPERIVALLRLLLPCEQCGAAPLRPCTRGLGEVQATHLTRGA